MTLTVLYFAAVGDLVGRTEERLALPPSVATVGALAAHLTTLHPALADRLRYVRFARNEAFAEASERLEEGDVIALLPPVAGGSVDEARGRCRDSRHAAPVNPPLAPPPLLAYNRRGGKR